MAGELMASFGPGDLFSEKSLGYDQGIAAVLGLNMKIRGISFPKIATKASAASYTGTFYIPTNVTLAAHTTFVVHVTDDGTNSADLSTNVYFGVTTKVLASTANTLDMDATADAFLGTEVTGSGTLGSASGGILAIAIAVSTGTGTYGSGAAVSNLVGVRIRRVGESTADTCAGRVLVPLVHVKNT